mgnify:CR=1 FL=1
MIVYNDGTWECGADEDAAPKNAVILPDDSAVAQQIRQYERVQLIGLTDNNDDIQVVPLEDRHRVILAELDRMDLQAVRPLRAIVAGTATEIDRQKLTEIEEQVAQLRQELAERNNQ